MSYLFDEKVLAKRKGGDKPTATRKTCQADTGKQVVTSTAHRFSYITVCFRDVVLFTTSWVFSSFLAAD